MFTWERVHNVSENLLLLILRIFSFSLKCSVGFLGITVAESICHHILIVFLANLYCTVQKMLFVCEVFLSVSLGWKTRSKSYFTIMCHKLYCLETLFFVTVINQTSALAICGMKLMLCFKHIDMVETKLELKTVLQFYTVFKVCDKVWISLQYFVIISMHFRIKCGELSFQCKSYYQKITDFGV